MAPDWLGSPQHVLAGLGLAFALSSLFGRRAPTLPVGWLLAIGVTAIAEIIVELIEYPLLYGDAADADAYYDTIADLAATLAGAIAGACLAIILLLSRRPEAGKRDHP